MNAIKLVTEPPHASTWPSIRRKCGFLKGTACGYPWCRCNSEWLGLIDRLAPQPPDEDSAAEGLVEVEEQVRGIKRANTQKDRP